MEDLRTIRSVRSVSLLHSSLPSETSKLIQQRLPPPELKRQLERLGQGHRRGLVLVDPPRRASQRLGRIEIPYLEHKPTFSADTFFGRSQLAADLRGHTVHAGGGLALVLGPRRIGKTSLAMRFLDAVADQPRRPHHVFFDLRTYRTANFDTVMDVVAGSIERAFGRRRPVVPGRPEDRISAILDSSDRPVVLVLDEFGSAVASFAERFLDPRFFEWIRRTAESKQQFSIVLVAPPAAEDLMRDTGAYDYLSGIPSVRLDVLDRHEAAEMIRAPFDRQGITIDGPAIDSMASLTGGHPYFLVLLIREVATELRRASTKATVSDADITAGVRRLVNNDSRFALFLSEHREHRTATACAKALAGLGASPREFVGASEVRRAATFDCEVADEEFDDAFARLQQYRLIDLLVAPGTEARYRFVVPLFRSWLRGDRQVSGRRHGRWS
jgi:hypothetical protein